MKEVRIQFAVIALGIIALMFIFIDVNTVEENVLGKYIETTSYFNESAVQEAHTAKILIDGEIIEVNVLSDFEQFHTDNTDIVVTIKKGRLSGFVYGYKATNKNTKAFKE